MLELKSNKDTSNVIFTLFIAHLFIIAISNYLVQYTFNIYGIDITWGTLTFPLIFLATDLTVRIVGNDKARKVVLLAMFPALIVSYVISVLFVSGKFTSFSELLSFNTFVFRIAIASFIAYVVGQLLDIKIFTKLREFKFWWLAPVSSTLFSSIVDTFCSFLLHFTLQVMSLCRQIGLVYSGLITSLK